MNYFRRLKENRPRGRGANRVRDDFTVVHAVPVVRYDEATPLPVARRRVAKVARAFRRLWAAMQPRERDAFLRFIDRDKLGCIGIEAGHSDHRGSAGICIPSSGCVVLDARIVDTAPADILDGLLAHEVGHAVAFSLSSGNRFNGYDVSRLIHKSEEAIADFMAGGLWGMDIAGFRRWLQTNWVPTQAAGFAVMRLHVMTGNAPRPREKVTVDADLADAMRAAAGELGVEPADLMQSALVEFLERRRIGEPIGIPRRRAGSRTSHKPRRRVGKESVS